MAKQTRQEYYDECKAQNLPLPELIKPGKGVASEDVNTADYREKDAKGEWGPWQRPKQDA